MSTAESYSREHWQIPTYTAEELQVKSARYCVCVFVINEGNKLHTQLNKMMPLSGSLDIVIADGGSSDNSTELNILRGYRVNTLLTKTGAGKLGAQMRMGFL